MANLTSRLQFSEFAKADISNVISALDLMPGMKDVTLDEPVMHHLDRLCGVKVLKAQGVCKLFSLNNQTHNSGGTEEQHIFILRPTMVNMKKVADQLNGDQTQGKKKKYKILMIPKKLHTAELILEQEGVHGLVTIDQLSLDFLILDTDLISLEIPDFFRKFYLENDQTLIRLIANSLCTLQDYFGPFKNIFGQGRCAQLAYNLMNDLYTGSDQRNSEIGYVFLFDRDIDYISVLMNQMTFEGMLDETFGIKNGVVQFGQDVTGDSKPNKVLLNSQDKLFEEVRDKHMSSVFLLLSEKVKTIQSSYDVIIGACEVIMKQKKTNKFDDYLQTEHGIVEMVNYKENLIYIEEMIHQQFSKLSVLRLLCLMSITQDGLSSRDYKFFVTQFLHSYGYEHLLTFQNLKKLGLFAETDTFQLPSLGKLADKVAAAAVSSLPRKSNFRAISRKLNLVPKIDKSYDLKNPTDMAYVYSGAYTPIIPRLVEHVIDRSNFSGIDDIMKLLPGSTIFKSSSSQLNSPPPVALVYFMGGVTRAEISALRLIGRMKGWTIIIATTAFINGSTMINSAREDPH
ncbi:Vacuolar protein sorting-associated protein 33B [Nymphon striatum]|nr:Vacuolar protein sorting-associated protein 33B [Nymphon striatum]